jgi:SRSO17 transposase
MIARDMSLAEQLERFGGLFRGAFRRREQASWATVYLRGLLQAGPRKTIEAIARHVALPPGGSVEDTAQALHHFINQSPWDADAIRRRHHALLAPHLAPDGLFVLEELAFVKQGRHSVGVHRQSSSALGHKVNCQLAVSLHHVSPSAYHPLALRLYLPRTWLQDCARLDDGGVPPEARSLQSKPALALQLLDEARAAGIPGASLAPGAGWGAVDELPEEAASRGLNWLPHVPDDLRPHVQEGLGRLQDDLGLGHFEGRSWRGFHHHACLVLLAHALFAEQADKQLS